MNKILQHKVYEAVFKQSSFTKTEKNAICCILYKYCSNLLNSDSANASSVNSIASSYCGSISALFKSLQSKYLSYNLILKEINDYNKDNFTQYTDHEIENIYKLYQNKTQVVSFSINNFSQYMYKVSGITHYQHTKLAQIHKKIMKPIAAYYMDKYGIADSNLEVYSATNDDEAIGREIIFTIKGINNSIVVNDVTKGIIPIDYYSIEVDGDYIKLITL